MSPIHALVPREEMFANKYSNGSGFLESFKEFNLDTMIDVIEVDELISADKRGIGGFGSTGAIAVPHDLYK